MNESSSHEKRNRGLAEFYKAFIGSLIAALVITVCIVFYVVESSKPPKLGGDFTLHSTHGLVSLHQFLKKGVVLYFGYTSCPDVCPISMHKLSQVIQSLPNKEKDDLQVIFVSVDYRGDTPEKVQNYADYFIKGGLGLTGSKKEIDSVVNRYGTAYFIEDTKNSALGYSVQHPTDFFLIDKKGRLLNTVPTEVSSDILKKSISELL